MKEIKLRKNCLICNEELIDKNFGCIFVCRNCQKLTKNVFNEHSLTNIKIPNYIPKEQRDQWVARYIIKYEKERVLNEIQNS